MTGMFIRTVLFILFLQGSLLAQEGYSYRDYDRYQGVHYNSRHSDSTRFYKKKRYKRHRRSNRSLYRYYRVRRGDSLYKIARKFGTSINRICQLNNLSRHARLLRGERIKVPNRKFRSKRYNRNRHTGYTYRRSYRRRHRRINRRPRFKWPVNYVRYYKRDGIRGVRSIGLVIYSSRRANVKSAASGIIARIGRMRGYGNYVVIKHSGRFITVYAHLSTINVSVGQKIHRGRIIGRMYKRKLHFQIDYAGKPKNPLRYLPRRRG